MGARDGIGAVMMVEGEGGKQNMFPDSEMYRLGVKQDGVLILGFITSA
jgi:hypothetical protein